MALPRAGATLRFWPTARPASTPAAPFPAAAAARNLKASAPGELHRTDGHGDGSLRRVDDGDAQGRLERLAVPRHAGTAHDDDVGGVPIAQLLADLDHAHERLAVRGRLGHAHVERPFPGEALHEAHLAQVA